MNFIKNNYKSILKYLGIYLFVCICYIYIFYFLKFGDSLTFYSFSHALKNGQVIYNDFNIITTPLYVIFMSLGLHIYDNYLMFIFEQAFLVTLFVYFVNKNLGGKKTLFLFSAYIVFIRIFLMTYNFFTLFFIIIIYYLEKKYSSKDYLIGFIIGLSILSKHVIGCMLLIPMFIICFRNRGKLFKRLVGVFIPCFIFLIYLIINKSLYSFINLCLLGLFDFGSNNSRPSGILFYLSILTVIILIYYIIKNKDKKYLYYLPCSFFFTYPIFDLHHFSYLIFLFLFCLIDNCSFKFVKYEKTIIIVFVIFNILLFLNIMNLNKDSKVIRCDNERFTLFYTKDDVCKTLNKKSLSFDKYCLKSKCVIIDGNSAFYKTTKNINLNYFDVPLYGNFGYDGTNTMIEKIDSLKDSYFIVGSICINDYDKYNQCDKKLANHIIKNKKYVEKEYDLLIYK